MWAVFDEFFPGQNGNEIALEIWAIAWNSALTKSPAPSSGMASEDWFHQTAGVE